MCNADIEKVTFNQSGEFLTTSQLKDKFYTPAFDLTFKQNDIVDLSFFSKTDEVCLVCLLLNFRGTDLRTTLITVF